MHYVSCSWGFLFKEKTYFWVLYKNNQSYECFLRLKQPRQFGKDVRSSQNVHSSLAYVTCTTHDHSGMWRWIIYTHFEMEAFLYTHVELFSTALMNNVEKCLKRKLSRNSYKERNEKLRSTISIPRKIGAFTCIQ